MTWIASIVQGASQIRGGFEQKRAAEEDSLRKEAGAKAEIEAAAQDETTHRRETRKLLGRMQAAQAQSGVMGASSDAVARQSAVDAELDALNIRYQGQLRAWALREGLQSDLQAGRAARTSGALSGAGSILQGVADYRRNN